MLGKTRAQKNKERAEDLQKELDTIELAIAEKKQELAAKSRMVTITNWEDIEFIYDTEPLISYLEHVDIKTKTAILLQLNKLSALKISEHLPKYEKIGMKEFIYQLDTQNVEDELTEERKKQILVELNELYKFDNTAPEAI